MTTDIPPTNLLPRFVILRHLFQPPAGGHWDVMLETDSALATWSIAPQHPVGNSFTCTATRLPDHRKEYLEYEGEISGNRGTVTRVSSGTYEQLSPEQFMLHGDPASAFSGTLTIAGGTMTFEP
jgi:hypothetical protein